MTGVGVICYEAFGDTLRCVRSILTRTKVPIHLYVFDNSEKDTNTKSYAQAHPQITYLSAGENVGCTRSRNRLLETYVKDHPAGEFLAIMDQDIEVQEGWLGVMLATAKQHKDAGIVAWKEGCRGHRKIVDGVVSEVASMCNLHRIESLIQIKKKWGDKDELPWCEKMFMHKFDTLICQRLNMSGWRTYIARGKQKIRHHHPHLGVRRNPAWRQHFAHSKKVLHDLQRTEKWAAWKDWGIISKDGWIEWLPS